MAVFVYGLALFRVTGRRTFGKCSALDITVSVVLGSSLSHVITGTALFGGIMIAMTLMMALRVAGIHQIVEIDLVVLEPSGRITVTKSR